MRLLSGCGHLNSKKDGPEENTTSLTSHVGKIRHPLNRGDGMYQPVTRLMSQRSRETGSARCLALHGVCGPGLSPQG